MIKYCLDTNIISLLCLEPFEQDKDYNKIQQIKDTFKEKIHFDKKGVDNMYITDITKVEILRGMNQKDLHLRKKYFNKENIKKLYPNTFIKDYEKYDVFQNIPYHSLAINERRKKLQFEKQGDILKAFLKDNKILNFCSDSFDIYKSIIESGCIKSKNFQNNDQSDVLIASIAINNNMILVTDNDDDFQLIEGLKVENWCE